MIQCSLSVSADLLKRLSVRLNWIKEQPQTGPELLMIEDQSQSWCRLWLTTFQIQFRFSCRPTQLNFLSCIMIHNWWRWCQIFWCFLYLLSIILKPKNGAEQLVVNHDWQITGRFDVSVRCNQISTPEQRSNNTVRLSVRHDKCGTEEYFVHVRSLFLFFPKVWKPKFCKQSVTLQYEKMLLMIQQSKCCRTQGHKKCYLFQDDNSGLYKPRQKQLLFTPCGPKQCFSSRDWLNNVISDQSRKICILAEFRENFFSYLNWNGSQYGPRQIPATPKPCNTTCMKAVLLCTDVAFPRCGHIVQQLRIFSGRLHRIVSAAQHDLSSGLKICVPNQHS